MNTKQSVKIIPTPNQISGVLEASVQMETLKKHLDFALTEWEMTFENGYDYSIESKEAYIEAAAFAKKLGRRGDRIEQVEETI